MVMGERLRGDEMIVAGELKIDLERMGVQVRDKDILVVVAVAGLGDILDHFLPLWRPWCRDRSTWAMVWIGRELRSWTE